MSTRLSKLVQRARHDPNAFIEFCVADPSGRSIRQARVHRELQDFLSDHDKALVELPRDHGKTTQVCSRIVWELGRDLSLRVKIVCATEQLAAERGRCIRDLLLNQRVRLVFPALDKSSPWSTTRFSIVRPANILGPSVTALGSGASATGSRADLLVCDDVVDEKALYSRAERQRVKQVFRENLMNLLEPSGRFWGLCTPWHGDDLNAELKKNAAYSLFRQAVGPDLAPVWVERWSRTALEARRAEIGVAAFSRAFRLVAMADGNASIPPEWVRFWTEPAQAERVVLAIDPAVSENAKADRSALVMAARCENEVRCLDAIARRVSTPDLMNLITAVDALWRPELILFESNSAFTGISDLMIRQAAFGAKVKKVVQSKDKAARASAFSVPVENGAFRLKGDGHGGVDPGMQDLFDEITTFPIGEHDDLLDAAMMATNELLNVGQPRAF